MNVDEIYRLDALCVFRCFFNLDPERNEKSLCLPAESYVRVFGNFRHPSAGLASAPHRSVIQSNADRHAQRIVLRSISVCRHESLLSALTASHVLRFFIVFTFVMYDRIRFVCSPLKSIVYPIRLFVFSVSNRDFSREGTC